MAQHQHVLTAPSRHPQLLRHAAVLSRLRGRRHVGYLLKASWSQLNTPKTSYFVASALTGVLMHHLGWVSTIAPTADVPAGQIDKCTPGTCHALWSRSRI